MQIESLSSSTPADYGSMSSIRDELFASLQTSRDYRHAFIEEAIRSRITAQIKALRDTMDYKQFAERIKRRPSWVYRLEDPNAAPPTIPTLLQIAEAFDIGLDVRFRPFSELLDDVSTLSQTSFFVPSFEEEISTGAFSHGKHTRKFRRNRRRPRASRPGSDNLPQPLPRAS
jgi:transcriptional regulator with XRE-family HTH domain